MGKALRVLKYIVFGVIMLLTSIIAAEWILSRIICHKTQPTDVSIPVFLFSNGTHTDIVLPVTSSVISWDTIFARTNTLAANQSLDYISIGWGDKGFYLETPTWADLKFSTAFKATFGLSTSALHCTYMSKPNLSDRCVTLMINEEQYERLIKEVLSTMKSDEQQKPIWINTKGVYGLNDAFYDANGSYNMFTTCNTWTNSVLKKSEIKSAVWLAFAKPLIAIYQ